MTLPDIKTHYIASITKSVALVQKQAERTVGNCSEIDKRTYEYLYVVNVISQIMGDRIHFFFLFVFK